MMVVGLAWLGLAWLGIKISLEESKLSDPRKETYYSNKQQAGKGFVLFDYRSIIAGSSKNNF